MSNVAEFKRDGDALTARRVELKAAANPARHMDYVIVLEGALEIRDLGLITIALSYVPDRVVLEPPAFPAYLLALGRQGWNAIEEIGAAVLGDVDSEIVPRFIRVSVAAEGAQPQGLIRHAARFEARQPNWANDALVSRLG